MNPLLLGVGIYVVVQLLVGLWVSRRIATEDDYLLAGRRMGYGLSTFSIFATWFGAETCIDAAGHVYKHGLDWGSTEPYAYALAIALVGVWLARPIWNAKIVTLADMFRTRFSPGVERVAALILIPTSVFWAAAQIKAFGHVITSASSMSFETATAIAAGVVVLYSASGGMLADAVTDVIQGIALTVGLVWMLVSVVGDAGGVSAACEAIQARIANPSEPVPFDMADFLETWASPILGAIVAQELLMRMSSARSSTVARRSSILAGLGYGLVGSIPVLLGLLAPLFLAEMNDAEGVLPALAKQQLTTFGFILFAGALVSAILSTVDSALLVSSSLLSHNIIGRIAPHSSERTKVRVARAGVVGFGIAAYAISLLYDSVGDLIDVTNEFGTSGIFVLLVFGMFTTFGGAWSAYLALVGGIGGYLVAPLAGGTHPYLWSIACAGGGYVLGAFVRPRESVARA